MYHPRIGANASIMMLPCDFICGHFDKPGIMINAVGHNHCPPLSSLVPKWPPYSVNSIILLLNLSIIFSRVLTLPDTLNPFRTVPSRPRCKHSTVFPKRLRQSTMKQVSMTTMMHDRTRIQRELEGDRRVSGHATNHKPTLPPETTVRTLKSIESESSVRRL